MKLTFVTVPNDTTVLSTKDPMTIPRQGESVLISGTLYRVIDVLYDYNVKEIQIRLVRI